MSDAPEQKKALDEQIQLARSRGANSLRMMCMVLAHNLHTVEDGIERFDGTDDLQVQPERINLAMLRICTDLLPRLRLDSAADAQAALLVVAARQAKA